MVLEILETFYKTSRHRTPGGVDVVCMLKLVQVHQKVNTCNLQILW
jgi:hypothetical protein